MFKNKQLLFYGNQLKYLEEVKREVEARKSKVANLSYRKKLRDNQNKENWCMIATSNRSHDVDPCFRRGGRFEKEIEVIKKRFNKAN
jgi:SpoVK/Ycf46/Vps4 family AAA+-type ATPase